MKQLIESQFHITADSQRIIYRGKVLKSEQTIESYGIQTDTVLHLVVRTDVSATTASSSSAATSTSFASSTTVSAASSTTSSTEPSTSPPVQPPIQVGFQPVTFNTAAGQQPGGMVMSAIQIDPSQPLPDLNRIVTSVLSGMGIVPGANADVQASVMVAADPNLAQPQSHPASESSAASSTSTSTSTSAAAGTTTTAPAASSSSAARFPFAFPMPAPSSALQPVCFCFPSPHSDFSVFYSFILPYIC